MAKTFQIFCVFAVLLFSDGSLVQDFRKFLKVKCSTTNKTCINLQCNLRPVSRYETFMNVRCEKVARIVTKPLFGLLTLKINVAGDYRQLVNIKNIDVCPIIEYAANFPIFKHEFLWFQESFPGLLKKCPYKSLDIVNATLKIKPSDPNVKWQQYPSGRYKTTMKVSDDQDENIFTITYWQEDYFLNRDREF